MSLASEFSDSSEWSARVQDTRLNANVTATHTEHIFARHGRRGGPREIWLRQSRLGRGSFGTVWLEECEHPYRRDTPPLRAVKEIHLQPGSNSQVDYTRELDAFAKFSQPKVSFSRRYLCNELRDILNGSMSHTLSGHSAGTLLPTLCLSPWHTIHSATCSNIWLRLFLKLKPNKSLSSCSRV